MAMVARGHRGPPTKMEATGEPATRPLQDLAAGEESGAGEGARTLDPDLGKVVLYH